MGDYDTVPVLFQSSPQQIDDMRFVVDDQYLPGYDQKELEALLKKQTDLETFYAEAPCPNPSRALIKGLICGVRVEDIKEPTMREIRYLDKLIDELAKGKALEKILRKN